MCLRDEQEFGNAEMKPLITTEQFFFRLCVFNRALDNIFVEVDKKEHTKVTEQLMSLMNNEGGRR